MPPSVLFQEKYGSLSATGFAKETVYGTAVAASSFLPTATNTLTSDPGLFYPDLMQGIRDKQVYPLYGEEKDIGAVTGPLFPSNAVIALVASIGTDAVTGLTPTYTHTISQGTSTMPSLTVEKNIGNFQSLQFAGTRVGKLQIKGASGNTAAEATYDLTAQSVAILDTPTAITLVNEEPFVFAEYTLTWNGAIIKQATNFQLDIDNGLKETYTFNQSHNLQFLTPASLKVSGQFDVVFDALDTHGGISTDGFFSQASTGTTGALSFALTHPASGGSITFSMPNVRLAKTDQKITPGTAVMEQINFEAYWVPSSYTIQAVVVNGVSTAY